VAGAKHDPPALGAEELDITREDALARALERAIGCAVAARISAGAPRAGARKIVLHWRGR
jgi:hypothetical protein